MYQTDLPIRDNLAAAHRRTLEHWARPGTWWDARQRLAIVGQVRTALSHADQNSAPLPPWVAPSSVDELADVVAAASEVLPAAAIDAVWRITSHPGTLTADWYEGVITELVDTGDFAAGQAAVDEASQAALAYVELVGIVAQANNLDRFADTLGLDRLELPEPEPGEPTRELSESVAVKNHWVPTDDASRLNVLNALSAVTAEDDASRPNVFNALSAVPAEVEAWLVLSDAGYVPLNTLLGDLKTGHASLTRPQIELVAARTSKLNDCFY